MVKGLTVRQPWAACIAHLAKRIENRPWRCPDTMIGARVAIHSSAAIRRMGQAIGLPDGDGFGSLFASSAEWDAWRFWHMGEARIRDRANWPPKLALGSVVAVATITGCHWRGHDDECGDPAGYSMGVICSPWAEPGAWHWELGDVRPLPVPVACSGALGFWTVPPETERLVRAQLEAPDA